MTEIVGKTGCLPHRGIKPSQERPVKHAFNSYRSDFHSVKLIYFGTIILLITEKVLEVNFTILGF